MSTTEKTEDIEKKNRKYDSVRIGRNNFSWIGVILIGIATCFNAYYTRQVESQLYVRPHTARLRENLDQLTQCIEDQVSVAISSEERKQGIRNCLDTYTK